MKKSHYKIKLVDDYYYIIRKHYGISRLFGSSYVSSICVSLNEAWRTLLKLNKTMYDHDIKFPYTGYISRSKVLMGDIGQDTGLVDRHNHHIHIGDVMEFDREVWGNDDNIFIVLWEDGELSIKGSINDLSHYCSIIGRGCVEL